MTWARRQFLAGTLSAAALAGFPVKASSALAVPAVDRLDIVVVTDGSVFSFAETTSGMAWAPVITFLQGVLGVERVLYAMDYPYQFEISEVVTHDALPISPEDKKRLYQTNAEAVFRLKA